MVEGGAKGMRGKRGEGREGEGREGKVAEKRVVTGNGEEPLH